MPAGDMAGHAMATPEPWSVAYLLPAFVMWSLMMVAMMLPSAAPMILLHARLDRAPTQCRRLWHTLVFSFCYVAVWTGFAAAAAAAQALLVDAGAVSAMSLAFGSRRLAAALLLVAALYQLTAAKSSCLDQCRSPLAFVLRYWRPGTEGAVRLGIRHGLYCLGCCWGLMLLLFVGGVMNIAWIAILAILVFVEKAAPPSWHASRWIALALGIGSAFLAFGI